MEFLPDSDALTCAVDDKWRVREGTGAMTLHSQNSHAGSGHSISGEKSAAKTDSEEANNTGDRFEFDGSYDETTEECLVSALMAGLYFIPPERILRHQTGWGRRVRYTGYRHIHPTWKSVSIPPHLSAAMESIHCAELDRATKQADRMMVGTFRIYKAKFSESVIERHMTDIERRALTGQRHDKNGISVSNAGGYHSKVVNVLQADDDTGLFKRDLAMIIEDYLRFIEEHDCAAAASRREKRTCIPDPKTCSLPGVRNVTSADTRSEGWINISTHGAYNRLHTHEGAAWSAVLYVKEIPAEATACRFAGNLLLKPSPHRSEDTYALSEVEKSRLNLEPLAGSAAEGAFKSSEGVCDYVSVAAERGLLFMMPSWLHHCVMPVAVRGEYRDAMAAPSEHSCTGNSNPNMDTAAEGLDNASTNAVLVAKRISLAMNFNATAP